MLSAIAVKSFKSRHPVTSTASDPSVVRRPWASTSRRNLAAKLRNTFSSAKRSHSVRFRSRSTIGNGHTRPNGFRTAGTPHSRRLQALDLRAGLGFDLGRIELVAKRSYDKVIELDAKLAGAVLCTGLQQAAYSVRRQERFAVE